MRPIDADLLSEEIKSLKVYVTGLRAGKSVLREYAEEYQKSILDIIDEQSTIEAEPVKHGQWLVDGYTGKEFCSNCGEIPECFKPNFCPNCGAKMDGGADNE